VDGAYIHTLKDWRNFDVNYPNAAGVRPLPDIARILDHQSISQYKYKGMYVRAGEALRQALPVPGSPTRWPRTGTTIRSAGNQTRRNYNLDWGPANIDRRQDLVASGSVNLPWKFSLGAIWQIRSSMPF